MSEICVVLDNIRSLHNVGSIFRTAEAGGVEKMYLCGITGTPPQDEIVKVSRGQSRNLPWEYHQDTVSLLKYLKKKKYYLVALEQTSSSRIYTDVQYSFPLALILGFEVSGIARKCLRLADEIVFLPMKGQGKSLNVSVAFGIALYQIIENCANKALFD